MERRSFLGLTLAGVGAASTSGCAQLLGPAAFLPDEVRELLSRLENGRTLAERTQIVSELARAAGVELPAPHRLAVMDRLASQAVSGLVAADVGLSLRGAAPMPAVEQRLRELGPELDRTIVAHTAMLTQAPADERRRIDRRLRAHPEAPMEIAQLFDDYARQTGVSLAGRTRLRQIAFDVSSRARKQSVGAVFDECTTKIERIAEYHGVHAELRQLVSNDEASAILWGLAKPDGGQSWATAEPYPGGRSGSSVAGATPHNAGQGTIDAGLGIGAAALGFGALGGLLLVAAPASWGFGAVSLTIGSILLLVSLITLSVGAAMNG